MKPQLLISVADYGRTPDNHTTRSTSSSGTQDLRPTPLPLAWDFLPTDLAFFTFSLGVSLVTRWHSWKRSSSPSPLVLWVAPLSHLVPPSRDWSRSFLLPLPMSFVYGDFSSLLAVGLGQLTLEQPELSVTGTREKSIIMTCKVFSKDFKVITSTVPAKPDQGLEQLLYVSTAPAQNHLGGKKTSLRPERCPLPLLPWK